MKVTASLACLITAISLSSGASTIQPIQRELCRVLVTNAPLPQLIEKFQLAPKITAGVAQKQLADQIAGFTNNSQVIKFYRNFTGPQNEKARNQVKAAHGLK